MDTNTAHKTYIDIEYIKILKLFHIDRTYLNLGKTILLIPCLNYIIQLGPLIFYFFFVTNMSPIFTNGNNVGLIVSLHPTPLQVVLHVRLVSTMFLTWRWCGTTFDLAPKGCHFGGVPSSALGYHDLLFGRCHHPPPPPLFFPPQNPPHMWLFG